MRKRMLLLAAVFMLFMNLGYSQDKKVKNDGYVFAEFLAGSVKMKSGSLENAHLNYDAANQTIVFLNDEQVLVLTNLQDVDTIYIADKKFIPVYNSVYEVVSEASGNALLAEYRIKKIPMTSTTDHNGTSKTEQSKVNNTVSNVYLGRNHKSSFSVSFTKLYLIKKSGSERLYKASSDKNFIQTFVGKKNEIAGHLASNPVDFRKESEIIRLFVFCNQ